MPNTETAATPANCADGCGVPTRTVKSRFLQGHDQRLVSALAVEVTVGRLTNQQRDVLGFAPADYDDLGDIQDRINRVAEAVAKQFSEGLARKFNSAALNKWDQSVKPTAEDRKAHAAAKKALLRPAKSSGESPATQAVMRNLQADKPGTFESVGVSFTLSSLEEYTRQAQAWLGDKSELRSKTIESADWAQVYAYFRTQGEVSGVDELQSLLTLDEIPEAVPASTVGQVVRGPGLTTGGPVQVKIGRWTYDATVHGMNQAGKVTAVLYFDKNGNEKVATEGKFTLVS
jgi:hypothetical protein